MNRAMTHSHIAASMPKGGDECLKTVIEDDKRDGMFYNRPLLF